LNHLDQFLRWVGELPEAMIYALLGFCAFLENLFPPIPGDTITAFGAFLVGSGKLGFAGVYAVTTIGSLAGFLALFQAGSYFGRHFFIERDFWFLKACDIIRAEVWFNRYGYGLILMNRFFPGIRSAIALFGGFSRLRLPIVVLLSLVSAAVWNLIWISMGYALGSNWDHVRESIDRILYRYNIGLVILFVLACGFLLVVRYRRRRRP